MISRPARASRPPVVLPTEQESAADAWRSEAWRWSGVAAPLAVLAALCLGRSF
ncbi:MAG TPA: hypothetical protein VGG91_12670 [Myxococcaceae bacterium]